MMDEMLYEYEGWTIEVSRHEDFWQVAVDPFFDRTVHLSQECGRLILFQKDKEEAYLELRIFDNGNITYSTYSPALLQVNSENKYIVIGLLDPSQLY